jgi:hypothetical protein
MLQQLIQQFYSQQYNMLMPQMMGAQGNLAASAARSGLTGSGAVKQLAAGIPGQFAAGALKNASNQALGVAGNKASILSGAPVQAPYSFGGDINNLASLASTYGLFKNTGTQSGGNTQTSNPWWIQGPGHGTQWT